MEENIKLPSVAVVDASFMLAFLLPDEKAPYTDTIIDACIDGRIKLLSSPILPYEIINAIRSSVVQKRITRQIGEVLIHDFLQLIITLIPIVFSELFPLTLKNNLTVYDASYLWISKTKRIPLLTLDKTLSRLSS